MAHQKFRAKSHGRYGKRHVPGEMNRTEEEYAGILETRRVLGEIDGWQFEPMTLKLAKDLRYTPDFAVLHVDGTLELIDTKGSGPISDTSLAKIKVAAEKFYYIQFTIAQKQTKKNGGGWKRREL